MEPRPWLMVFFFRAENAVKNRFNSILNKRWNDENKSTDEASQIQPLEPLTDAPGTKAITPEDQQMLQTMLGTRSSSSTVLRDRSPSLNVWDKAPSAASSSSVYPSAQVSHMQSVVFVSGAHRDVLFRDPGIRIGNWIRPLQPRACLPK